MYRDWMISDINPIDMKTFVSVQFIVPINQRLDNVRWPLGWFLSINKRKKVAKILIVPEAFLVNAVAKYSAFVS